MQYKHITLENVKNLDIVEVISSFLNVERKGSNYIASCPFHDEKTPSFIISPSKQIYHCFGCGAKGDSIQFVMDYKQVTFVEAIQLMAELFNIPIEYEHCSDDDLLKDQQKRKEKKELHDALLFCRDFFERHSPKHFLTNRNFSNEVIETFQLGFAPKGNLLLQELKRKNKDLNTFEKIGVIKKGDNGYYDVFQNRIIIPIQNRSGYLVAFTGRNIEENSKYPKYFNSSDKVYQKGNHLYGLNHSYKYIQKEGFVYLVEGNLDVIQMHNKGIKNVIAQGGTALTEEQVKLIQQVTNKVCIVPDKDPAGINAFEKNAIELIKKGLYVFCSIPTKKDADEDLRNLSNNEVEEWKNKRTDFITQYLLNKSIKIGDTSPIDLVEQIKYLGETIDLIQDEVLRNTYYDTCKKSWKEFGKNYKLKGKRERNKEEKESLSNQDEHYGFIEKNGSYFVLEKEGQEKPISNFTMEALFFITHKDESKYYVRLRHKRGREACAIVTTDDFTAVQTFSKAIERHGHFFFTGNNAQLYKLKEKLLYGISIAQEQSILGNYKDYYVWGNGIFYNNKFYKANRHGVVKINRPITSIDEFETLYGGIKVKIEQKEILLNSAFDTIVEYGEEYISEMIEKQEISYLDYVFLPAASKTIIRGQEQDNYSEIRKFSYSTKSTLKFKEWSNLMTQSYANNNGMIGVAYYIMSLNRNVVFEKNNNWNPLLFCFGLPQKGKSKFAESLASMFGKPIEDGINLEGGSTATGIRRFMAGRSNAIVWLNEYKNDLPLQTIGMLKSLADGSGKIQGQKTTGVETSHYKPLSTSIICGQDLPTKDPALLSRCILCEFDGTFGNYDSYELLKEYEYEQETTNVTCELLQYQYLIKKHYKKYLRLILKNLKDHCRQNSQRFEDRAFLNIASLLAPISILMEHTSLEFPFTNEELAQELLKRVELQEKIRQTADEVEQFFTTVMAMVHKDIYEMEHFKVGKDRTSGEERLYIRLKKIYPLYLEKSRKQGLTAYHEGVIRNYLEKHPSYIGVSKVKFNKTSTTAMSFNYEYLKNIEIEFD